MERDRGVSDDRLVVPVVSPLVAYLSSSPLVKPNPLLASITVA